MFIFLVNHFATREKFTPLEKNWPHAGLLFDTTGNRSIIETKKQKQLRSIIESFHIHKLVLALYNILLLIITESMHKEDRRESLSQ